MNLNLKMDETESENGRFILHGDLCLSKFILDGILNPNRSNLLESPWSDRAAQIVKPSDLCHVHVESIPFSWYGLLT
jgi:hypothetical protein